MRDTGTEGSAASDRDGVEAVSAGGECIRGRELEKLRGWTKAPCSFAIVQKCCNFHQHSIKRRTNPCLRRRLICAVVARLAAHRSQERWRGPPGSRPLRKSGTSASPSDLDQAQARSPRVFTRIVVRPLAWQVLDAAASLASAMTAPRVLHAFTLERAARSSPRKSNWPVRSPIPRHALPPPFFQPCTSSIDEENPIRSPPP